MTEEKKWRLGLDMGTNSIGWAALKLDSDGKPCGLIDAGVRIFSDGRNPKDGQSNAVARRLPRQMRRNRDRYLKRRGEFMDRLIEHGLMPEDEAARKELEKLDPWELRVRGLDEELPLHHLGRALFHLQQRRGFKSNRKTDAGDDDSNKIERAKKELEKAMGTDGARTPGEYLGLRRRPAPKDDFRKAVDAEMERCGKSCLKGNKRKKAKNKIRKRLAAEMEVSRFDHVGVEQPPARVRLRERMTNKKGKEVKERYYDFYPTRDLVEAEFNALWDAQAQSKFHGEALKGKEALLDALLFQRDLKPQPVGKCTLDPGDDRAPWALPSAQQRRIYQDINHLEIRFPVEKGRKLTDPERRLLVDKALSAKTLSFNGARRALKMRDAVFNLESERRTDLKGDETAHLMAAGDAWGGEWRSLPLKEQDAVVERLLKDENKEALVKWLAETHGLKRENAETVANLNLPAGYGNLGRKATAKVLKELMAADVPTYNEAVERAGYGSHSNRDHGDGEIFDRNLPYYGQVLERHVAFDTGKHHHRPEKRFGKIANPTVHVALNQLRRTINALMKEYGAPEQIIVEMARNLPLSAKGKSDLLKEQTENKKRNDKRREILAEYSQMDTYENRLRVRLWEELNPQNPHDRCCPYTGEKIGVKRLFSSDFEIEHILPFSKTLDDSPNNKTLARSDANRQKSSKPTPYEVFSEDPEYQNRVIKMAKEKQWRFAPDAMERYENQERNFLARQLVDTRYLSRIATAYLKRTGADVWVTPGRLTADLRRVLGLDSILRGHNQPGEEESAAKKNRDDHRHHAIDAVVVGLIDEGLLNKAARIAGQSEENSAKRYLAKIEEPWTDFRETVRARIEKIVVSHKPDHGVQGSLHNDTAYGIVEDPDKDGLFEVVHRVPLSSIKTAAALEAIREDSKVVNADSIKSRLITEAKKAEAKGLTGAKFTAALVEAGEAMRPPVRKVRIRKPLSVIPIGGRKNRKNRRGHPYKAYKGDANYCYDIWGGAKGKWTGEVVSRFDANQPGFDTKAERGRNGQPLIMRLRKNDVLAVEEPGAGRRLMNVAHVTKGKIALAEHYEANVDARNRDREDNFSYKLTAPSTLQKLKARLVRVDPAGRVFDPGPHK